MARMPMQRDQARVGRRDGVQRRAREVMEGRVVVQPSHGGVVRAGEGEEPVRFCGIYGDYARGIAHC